MVFSGGRGAPVGAPSRLSLYSRVLHEIFLRAAFMAIIHVPKGAAARADDETQPAGTHAPYRALAPAQCDGQNAKRQ